MYIDVWYDKQYKTWCTQLKDSNNNQIGYTDYSYSKHEALLSAKRMQADNNNCDIMEFLNV